MAFLARATREDLVTLATELGETLGSKETKVTLKDIILTSEKYEEEYVKELLLGITEERKAREEEKERWKRFEMECEERKRKDEMEFELQKLKLQQNTTLVQTSTGSSSEHLVSRPKWDLQTLIHRFDPSNNDISLYLTLFERQAQRAEVPREFWASHLIGLLPGDIAQLLARENEEVAENFDHIKALLLKRYQMTPEKFRQLFSRHVKGTESSWTDFAYEVRNYFHGWINGLGIKKFEDLIDLMITDQIKRKVPPEVREHFLNEWTNITSSKELAQKLDDYEMVRLNIKKESLSTAKKWLPSKNKTNPQYQRARHQQKPRTEETKPAIYCYGCSRPGYIKAKCPTCTPAEHKDRLALNFLTLQATSSPLALIDVNIAGLNVRACADTGATQTVAGELLYSCLLKQGVIFQPTKITMTLANGCQIQEEACTASVTFKIERKIFALDLLALPEAKRNRTLLGTDFLGQAGIVLDLKHKNWYFYEDQKRKIPFRDDIPVNLLRPVEKIPETGISLKDDPGRDVTETNACQEPDALHEDLSAPNIVEVVQLKICCLREEEGEGLTKPQLSRLNQLLIEYQDTFNPGGEPTPYIEHRIDTGNAPPVATTPYRMSPARQEILKKELKSLLNSGIIEECDSPYAAPVVLIPKPNGEFRLCVDYRKLNLITKSDPYPLPRMDDLLQKTSETKYMSTIDLKAGYHQVKMCPSDMDKTAFVCPFGVFRFKRMPFGLKTAPATFQRLIDLFRNGLNVNTLAYLDDIIIMSPTFEKHLEDLRLVFERLKQFKLTANREKCHFMCKEVKYLGHLITRSGIEVDPAKVSAILDIPPPKNVKQLQSFLQTCSWYRRFIPNFAGISKPLSTLTRKRSTWTWGSEEQNSFDALKKSLISPPVLKQLDVNQPFILRTDASAYALGAVLSQNQGSEEHPIEYASRLLIPAERNYSTTEREALAVVWALEKFRGYIEGAEIRVVSDHQPLKWLLSLKTPTGRLARWALQIQSFNLKFEYIPGKANVVADMLSRPPCSHGEVTCETCAVMVDLPAKSSSEIRERQLEDEDLRKIIETFEQNPKDENFLNWTSRGYLMSQGVLYRYAPESDSEEAQLVVPRQQWSDILKEHHDAPTAGHYGEEGTYQRISKRYYWSGMRSFISDYVKKCSECARYKAENQKPAGLLRTPAYSQRFETIAIDLFGPLPETPDGKKWIFIIEDTATKWIELFALRDATARECAITLVEEVILRYGLPRRLISDNGTQFVSAVMQQVCNLLDIDQCLTPVYCPQANPVERKNRDLKPRIAILVGNGPHTVWAEKLPVIRFAMNSAKCSSTGYSAAFLQFGREMRTADDVKHDLRSVIHNDNFVAEITPYLKRFANLHQEIRDRVEMKQDERKEYADKKRRNAVPYAPGDRVWVTTHMKSNKTNRKSAKFMPRRDGPYIVTTQRSLTSYEVADPNNPDVPLGTYHSSALRPCLESHANSQPVHPLRRRGRPKKNRLVPTTSAGFLSGRQRSQRGSPVARISSIPEN